MVFPFSRFIERYRVFSGFRVVQFVIDHRQVLPRRGWGVTDPSRISIVAWSFTEFYWVSRLFVRTDHDEWPPLPRVGGGGTGQSSRLSVNFFNNRRAPPGVDGGHSFNSAQGRAGGTSPAGRQVNRPWTSSADRSDTHFLVKTR